MSSKAPQNNTTVDSAWRGVRYHYGLRYVRRGPDKKLHFPGQEEGEVVKAVVRRHPWFIVVPAFPLLGSIAFFVFMEWASTRFPELYGLWFLLKIVALLVILITAIFFLWRDFIIWWREIYIITNKRIITWRGILPSSRQETPISKIQQVAFDQDTPMAGLFSYGTVHLYLIGKQVQLKDVPKSVQDLIERLKAESGKSAKKIAPVPTDPEMVSLLNKLAEPEKAPELPDPDAKYPPRPGNVLGPRRTFGGPLRIECNVHYTLGESTVMYIQRSPWVLVWRMALPIILLVAVILLAFFKPVLWFLAVLVILILLIALGLIYVNYVDDVYILTNKRIIDIERKYLFLYQERDQTEYKNIRDVRVKIPNVIELILDIGNIYVETPGATPDIVFHHVEHPFYLQDKIYELQGLKEKMDKVKAANDLKEELNYWFGHVTMLLGKKIQNRGVPNLQRLDYWSAAERAREFGLHLVLMGEDTSYPNLEPGVVVEQNPPPGTLMAEGGEVQVLLSKRAY